MEADYPENVYPSYPATCTFMYPRRLGLFRIVNKIVWSGVEQSEEGGGPEAGVEVGRFVVRCSDLSALSGLCDRREAVGEFVVISRVIA
jgi:hypothetical protein